MSSMYPLLWRFLPALDDDVNVVNVRDLDSVVGRREADAVKQFLDSDKVIITLYRNKCHFGQWFWLIWQSGHFQYQRFPVRIQSSATFYRVHIFCQPLKRRKKEKRPGMAKVIKQIPGSMDLQCKECLITS